VGKCGVRIAAALAVVLAATVARAEPPALGPQDEALAAWFRSLMIRGGTTGCCAVSDCRNTVIEWRADGRPYAWIGRGPALFGDDAPDAWLPIPEFAIQERTDNPTGRPVVCYSHGTILCVVWAPGS
jgi:hypothetical protein